MQVEVQDDKATSPQPRGEASILVYTPAARIQRNNSSTAAVNEIPADYLSKIVMPRGKESTSSSASAATASVASTVAD